MIATEYLTPILVFSVLDFILGFFFVFYYVVYKSEHECCSKNEVNKNEVNKNEVNKNDEHTKLLLDSIRKDVLIVKLNNQVRIEELEADISINEDAILELYDRLNLLESEIKKIKKEGKKNVSNK